MTIQKWCKIQGMSLEQYREYLKNVRNEAQAIYEEIAELHTTGTGIYFLTSEIIPELTQERCFVIDELKNIGIEFIDNLKFYRMT